MYTICTEAHFDSAHFLAGYDGKCSNLHGHRWRVAAWICAGELIPDGPRRGMVVDFGDAKRILAALADDLDHALLYEEGTLRGETLAALAAEHFRVVALPFRPTAECLAKYFCEQLAGEGLRVLCVEVDETPESRAFYRVETGDGDG